MITYVPFDARSIVSNIRFCLEGLGELLGGRETSPPGLCRISAGEIGLVGLFPSRDNLTNRRYLMIVCNRHH